jgi:hypothetical protein
MALTHDAVEYRTNTAGRYAAAGKES